MSPEGTGRVEAGVAAAGGAIARLLAAAEQVILGKPEALRLALACLLAGGHLLIEDQPGVGKTTLAHLLARLLGLGFQRVQFTSDLLPADLLGVSIFDRTTQHFHFQRGPIFTHVLLADEVNRATPRAQSALLEAMEERQVTIEGVTHPLPAPFFVIATQNPTDQAGTFPLPESQLDRFLMRISLGYPDRGAERALLRGEDRRALIARLPAMMDHAVLEALQQQVQNVHVADPLLAYVQDVLAYTRGSPRYATGLSPRAGLALLRAAKAWALTGGRNHVLPEDLQAVLGAVVVHRLRATDGSHGPALGAALREAVPIP
ncbi:MAG: AAA family ATPase [Gammaproteobacteria bacterium]|nr:AAA family ATPase [Gammaproteobacteria bacterium]MBI5616530.1 AAA family ATPase [Gammaproteobacteria bacterium]